MKKAALFLLLLPLLSGCHTVMKPFQPLPQNATLEQRQEAYDLYSLTSKESFWLSPYISQMKQSKATGVLRPRWVDFYMLQGYYRSSGDEASAQLAKTWENWQQGALITESVGLGVGLWGVYETDKTGNEALQYSGLGLAVLGIVANMLSYHWYLMPSVASFNKYLKGQLQLSVVPDKTGAQLQTAWKF